MKKTLCLILLLNTYTSALSGEPVPLKADVTWKISSISRLDKMMPESSQFTTGDFSKPDEGIIYSFGTHNNMYDKSVYTIYGLSSRLLLIIDQFPSSGVDERSRVCLFDMKTLTHFHTGYAVHLRILDALKIFSPYKGCTSFIHYINNENKRFDNAQALNTFYKDTVSQIDSPDDAPCTLELVQ